MKKENTKIKETSDIQLATYLHCIGFVFEGADKTNPHRVSFVFQEEEGIDEAVTLFLEGKARIEPQSMFSSYQFLKKLIFDRSY